MKGSALREIIRTEMHGRLLGPAAPYNLKAAERRLLHHRYASSRPPLGIRDIGHLTDAQRRDIRRAHLLLATVQRHAAGRLRPVGLGSRRRPDAPGRIGEALIADGDTRWINRGAYDLLGKHSGATKSSSGLPRAHALYGPLPEQLKRPDSFASQLSKMLRVRAQYRINESEQVELPAVEAQGLVVMVHRLPAGAGHRGHRAQLRPDGRPGGRGDRRCDRRARRSPTSSRRKPPASSPGKRLPLALGPHQGQVLLLK